MRLRPELKLAWCSHAAAKYAVEQWHYSKRLPVGKTVKIGVWEDGRFLGCVVFARGANRHLSRPYGLSQLEGTELTRVALAPHRVPVSRVLALSVKMLVAQSPGLRLVCSFADTRQGHLGVVYQASNWIYTGTTPAQVEYWFGGRWVHSKQAHNLVITGKVRTLQGLPKRPSSVKHRYLYPLDAAMRAQLAPLAQPYPKRATSIASDAAALQAAEGGATPTVALDACLGSLGA